MRSPLRWVLWDVKDTLLKVRRSVGEQYCLEAERIGLTLPPSDVDKAFRQAYRQNSRLYPNYGTAQGMGGHAWWVQVVRDTFSQCRVTDTALLDQLAHNLYQNFSSPNNWEVFPDSVDALKSCTALGLKLGVVSNFDSRLEGILQGCGLLSYFTFLMTSERAKVAKPDPAIFQQAMELCGAPASCIAHVGDHHANDYLAARALGIHAFLLDRQANNSRLEVPAQHQLRSLDEVASRLLLVTESGQ